MIRLPEKMSKDEKLSRMKNVVDALDLNNCLDTSMLVCSGFFLFLSIFLKMCRKYR